MELRGGAAVRSIAEQSHRRIDARVWTGHMGNDHYDRSRWRMSSAPTPPTPGFLIAVIALIVAGVLIAVGYCHFS